MTFAVIMISLISHHVHSWTSNTSDEIWRSGWGQGWAEAQVTHGSGNEIYVACENGSGQPSSVSFQLAGKPPRIDSEVILVFDKEKPEGFSVGANGRIVADCRACEANFSYVLGKLKSHSSIYVRFSDGRESTFTLKGAKKAIGDCKPGWP